MVCNLKCTQFTNGKENQKEKKRREEKRKECKTGKPQPKISFVTYQTPSCKYKYFGENYY